MAKPSPKVKTRFKMYKKGKLWLVAAAATAGLMAGGNVAQADNSTATSNSDQAVVANTNTGTSNDNNSGDDSTVALTTTTAVSNDSQVATASEDAVSTTANESTSATNTTQKATSSTDQAIDSASQASTEASKAAETVEQSTASATQDNQSNAKTGTSSNAEADTVSMTTAAASASATDQSSTSATKATEVYSNGHWYLKDQNGKNLTGWQKLSDNRTVYYNTAGEMLYGEQNISSKWYFFNTTDGNVAKGWYKLPDGRTVYYDVDNDGNGQGMLHGMQKVGNDYYYFNNDNGMEETGLKNVNGKYYYFDPTMTKNVEKKVNGSWYYFGSDGAAKTGWYTLSDGRLVNYNSQGQMYHGEAKINGKWYYFDQATGKVAQGWYKLPDGRQVYYDVDNNGNGQGMLHGMQQVGNDYYYFNNDNGAEEVGLKNVNGKYYYFNPTMTKNTEKKVNGSWYYFGSDGAAKTGWYTLSDGRLVNYNSQGQMYHGEAKINGKWYYFDQATGKVAQGWYKLPDGRQVYYDVDNNGNGQGMLHGMQKVANDYYYFNSDNGNKEIGIVYNSTTQKLQYYGTVSGALITDTTIKLGNNTYTIDGNGNIVLKNGENEINGYWYYYNKSTDKVVTGWYKLSDGREVYYDLSTAQMSHGEKKINGYWYYFDKNNGSEAISQFVKLNDGRMAYYDEQGHMSYGEKQIGGYWFYFDKNNGNEAISQFIKLSDGRIVYYNGDGHMLKGWQTINGNTFYFDLANGNMYTGTHYIDGTKHTFGSDGVEDTWGWPFPADGRGYFTGAQLFGVNAGGEFRLNGFHDGLDFGSIDHPGYEVHAVHKGTVTAIGYASGLDWYVLIDTGEYLTVYQEAFSSRSNIWVSVGQQVNIGDVIGGRTTAHLHLGITRQKNFSVALANSFNNNGTWINPLTLLGN